MNHALTHDVRGLEKAQRSPRSNVARKPNMKTKNRINLTPPVTVRRNLTVRTAVASLALAAATIPMVAGYGAASKENSPAIRPFQFHASEEALTDLRRRLVATQWPERETVTDASQGVPLATMRELVRYWATE